MKKNLLLLFAAACTCFSAQATKYISNAPGPTEHDGQSSASWMGGNVPSLPLGSGDTVVIRSGDVIKISSVSFSLSGNSVLELDGTLVLDQCNAQFNAGSIILYTNSGPNDQGFRFNNANGYSFDGTGRTAPLDVVMYKNLPNGQNIPSWPSELNYFANVPSAKLTLMGNITFDSLRVTGTRYCEAKPIGGTIPTKWFAQGIVVLDALYPPCVMDDSHMSIPLDSGKTAEVLLIDSSGAEKTVTITNDTSVNVFDIWAERGIRDSAGIDISDTRPSVKGTVHINAEYTKPLANIEMCFHDTTKANGFDETKAYISHYDSTTRTWDSIAPQVAVNKGSGIKCVTRDSVRDFSPFAIFDVNTRPNRLSVSELTERITTSISLYPNPATGILNVVYAGRTKTVEILIYNVEGRYVGSYTMMNGMASINVSSFNTGAYYLVLRDEAGLKTQQFIKQ